MFSSANSSYSSSLSSSDPHLPYIHPHPSSTTSLGSQNGSQQSRRNPMPPKYPRFYASPVDNGCENTPVQVYGFEQREPSIMEKPKLFRRVSHVLGDIKEDMSLSLADPESTAAKLRRRSTLMFETNSRPPTSSTLPPPRSSRAMSIISVDSWSMPRRDLSRRLSRRLSVFSRSKSSQVQTQSISTPNLISSSNHMEEERTRPAYI